MAKKVKEIWVSDVVSSVEFDSEKDQIEFDKKIQSKEWYLEKSKKYLNGLNSNDFDFDFDFDYDEESGVVKVNIDFSFTTFIQNDLEDNNIHDTYFDDITELIPADEYEDIDEDILNDVSDYIFEKISDYSEEIDSLIKVEVA